MEQVIEVVDILSGGSDENASQNQNDTGTGLSSYISIEQLPVISERLHEVKSQIEAQVNSVTSLVCTEENLIEIKKVRAAINSKFDAIDEQRKTVKQKVMAPIDDFDKTFKECITVFRALVNENLSQKITSVENGMKLRCEEGLREYFEELRAAEHVEWLLYEQTGVKVDMSSARAKNPTKLRKKILDFVCGISRSQAIIADMEFADEIMVEFKRTLDATTAISIIQERHKRIAEETQNLSRYAQEKQAETKTVAKVDAIQPPVLSSQTEEPEFFEVSFTVKAKREKIVSLINFMDKEGIKYE